MPGIQLYIVHSAICTYLMFNFKVEDYVHSKHTLTNKTYPLTDLSLAYYFLDVFVVQSEFDF